MPFDCYPRRYSSEMYRSGFTFTQNDREDTHTRSESIHFLLNRIDRFLMIGRWALEFSSLRWCSRNTERITRSDPNVPKRIIISSAIRSSNSFCQYLRLFWRVNTNTPTSELDWVILRSALDGCRYAWWATGESTRRWRRRFTGCFRRCVVHFLDTFQSALTKQVANDWMRMERKARRKTKRKRTESKQIALFCAVQQPNTHTPTKISGINSWSVVWTKRKQTFRTLTSSIDHEDQSPPQQFLLLLDWLN